MRTADSGDRIQMRKGMRQNEKKTSKKQRERWARVIILGRASPLGPGDDDDNNNLNRGHLAYV